MFAVFLVSAVTVAVRAASGWTAPAPGSHNLMLSETIFGMIALALPIFFAQKCRVRIPSYILFGYAAYLLATIFFGEVLMVYYRFTLWDTFMHALSGALLCAMGFSMLDSFNRSGGGASSGAIGPFMAVAFGFCLSMTLGILWEVYEFTVDYFCDTNMQRYAVLITDVARVGQAALYDTIKDTVANTVGALAASIAAFVAFRRDSMTLAKTQIRKME